MPEKIPANQYSDENPAEILAEKIVDILFSIRTRIERTIALFAPAPTIKGIDPRLQEQDWLKLILLRLKAKINLDKLTFEEMKKLELSEGFDFAKNYSLFKSAEYGIDDDVVPLIETINAHSFMFSVGSCSGHLDENPANHDECIFNDTGFVNFLVDKNDNRSDELIKRIQKLCEEETHADPDCIYFLETNKQLRQDTNDSIAGYTLMWHWNNPLYNKFRELNELRLQAIIKEDDESKGAKIRKEMDQLHEERKKISPLARQKQIRQRHIVFIKKATELIQKHQ